MRDLRALPALGAPAEHGGFPGNRPEARVLTALPAADLVQALLIKMRHVDHVAGRLDTQFAVDALRVLGRIGPVAAGTADRLVAYATGRDPGAGREHGRCAAWAHWRVTGDPELALDVCGTAVRSGSGSHGLPFLADLGPLAAAHADAVLGLTRSPGGWTRVAAAYAYWRITGDAEPAVPVLLAEVDPEWTGNPAMPVREAVRRLGETGAPAAEAAPLLRGILARGERLGHDYVGTRILADDAYTRTLTEALARLGPPPGRLAGQP
ncbi:hypothetical protein ACIA6E_23225 [Streptomyces sp. NPDC051815]|uniref:hypothetical protein n=1 Tax=Streptomyces sp. NPDC051815 TaxID=3365674 RepID=UPI00378A0287